MEYSQCADIDNALHIGVSGGALRVNLFNICTDRVIVFSMCKLTEAPVLLHTYISCILFPIL